MSRASTEYERKSRKHVDNDPPAPQAASERPGEMSWLGTLALVALPVLCCGLPLLALALVATGAGAWLAAHGSLLAIPAVVLAAGLRIARYARRRTS